MGKLVLLAMLTWMAGCATEPDRPEEVDARAASYVTRMNIAHQQDNLHAALAWADSAARFAPGLPEVNYTRGLVLSRLRRYDEARDALRSVLERDPDYPGAWYNLGHNAFLQRQYREALGYYEQERALVAAAQQGASEPRPPEAQAVPTITSQIGRTYEKLGVADSARLAYEQALAADSTLAVAHAWLSELDESQGKLEEALRHAVRALASEPGNVEYAYRVGFLLYQTGQAEEAVPILAAVAQRWPGHEGAAYNLGRALQALGREEEGQVYLDRVEELRALQEQALLAERGVVTYPNDPQRWITLADLMLQIGYYDKAEEAFKAALALKPGDLALQNDLANLAFARRDTAVAILRFQNLLRQDSTFIDAWLNLGIVYALSGREEAARQAWRAALRLNPGDQQAQDYLDQLELNRPKP